MHTHGWTTEAGLHEHSINIINFHLEVDHEHGTNIKQILNGCKMRTEFKENMNRF